MAYLPEEGKAQWLSVLPCLLASIIHVSARPKRSYGYDLLSRTLVDPRKVSA
ncbi:hypothetical protein TM239_50040 [Bradyrhizobium sp. TM239]|nr:hypothetical protein TM239_50040 [Bradyrhizobium sp. TM239]